MHTNYVIGKPEDLGVNGKAVLEWMLGKKSGNVWDSPDTG
jgi:hypothetical protein